MKKIIFLFSLFLSGAMFAQDIDLSKIEKAQIDLSEYSKSLEITGKYKGERLVFKNADGHVLRFVNVEIQTSHPEDAIAFDGYVRNLVIIGERKALLSGALTFWGIVEGLEVSGLRFRNCHSGIRITSPQPHSNITIKDCHFLKISHEGLYIGPSTATNAKVSNVKILRCKFNMIGWDAIQVGNAVVAEIYNNEITQAGTAKVYGQDYGITVNPGSIAYINNNTITDTEKPVQILDSRAFFHVK